MSTSTLVRDEQDDRHELDDRDGQDEQNDTVVSARTNAGSHTRPRLGRTGLTLAGLVALLTSAWGGIVPFVGPLFGYSGDGSNAWHWSLPHAFLALVPGLAGALLGLLIVAESRGITVGRGRLSLATAGTLLMVCGAWFAIGPLAWPVVSSSSSAYFVASSHLGLLEKEVGYSIGTGLILVICGAFVDGWASRHRPAAAARAHSRSRSGSGSRDTVESGI
jgi:hypothetical protein